VRITSPTIARSSTERAGRFGDGNVCGITKVASNTGYEGGAH
jgi:hypothetical protein